MPPPLGHPSGYRFRSAGKNTANCVRPFYSIIPAHSLPFSVSPPSSPTAEFASHLRWLATDPTHDDANCECFACHKTSGTSRKRSVDSVSPGTPTRALRTRPSIERKAKTAAETPARRTTGKRAVTRKAKKARGERARGKKAKDGEEDEEEDEIDDSGEDKAVNDHQEGSGTVADADAEAMEIDETKSKEKAVNGKEP